MSQETLNLAAPSSDPAVAQLATPGLNIQSSDSEVLKAMLEGINRINDLLKSKAASSEDSQDMFWSTYLKEAKNHDDQLMEKYKNDMEIVVFFAGLFSAVVAAFVAAMQTALSPNPSDNTNTLLMILIHTIDNSTFPDQPTAIPPWTGPPYAVVCSLTLSYVSLSLSLLAALGAMLGKQWLTRFNHLGEGTNEVRSRRRQQKLDGLKTWKFDVAMKVLPALLHVALALFAVALTLNLWGTSRTVAWALICVTTLGGLVYMAFTLLSLFFPSCPYETPFSAVIRWIILTAINTAQEFVSQLQFSSSRTIFHILGGLMPLLLLPVFGWGTVLLTTIILALFVAAPLLVPVKYLSASERRESLSNSLSDFKDQLHPATQRYPELRSIAWILETSYHHDIIMAAVERIPDAMVHTPKQNHDLDSEVAYRDVELGQSEPHRDMGTELSLDFLPLLKHLHELFNDSVGAMNNRFSVSRQDRTVALGKALVGMLSQLNFDPAVYPFCHKARQNFENILAQGSTESNSTTYLLRLLIALLRIQNGTRGMNQPQLRATQIPEQLLFWSLPFLRSALRLRPNQELFNFFSMVPQVIEGIRFADKSREDMSSSDQSSFFRACQAYLGVLREQPCYRPGAAVGENDTAGPMRTLSDTDWNVLRCAFANVRDADVSIRLREDGCLPELLKELSTLLRRFRSSWPQDIRDFVHTLAFDICLQAENHPTRFPRRLVVSVLDLAATDIEPDTNRYTDIGKIRPLLLDHLVDSEDTASEDRSVYLLKLFKASPAQAKSLWLDIDVVSYLANPGRGPRIQQISLEVLAVTCESPDAYLNDIMEHVISHRTFPRFIRRAIESFDPTMRASGFQFLDVALSYLVSFEDQRELWKNELKGAIYAIKENDLPPGVWSLPSLIRIRCALYSEEYKDELSTYWAGRMTEKNGLAIARVVPTAYWVLTMCEPSQPLAWYDNLQNGFEQLLKVAWSGDFGLDPTPVHELISCTEKWWRCADLSPDTTDAMQDPADTILMDPERYKLSEDDIDALQNLRNIW